MPKRGANVSLSSYDEIFSTEETRSQENLEKIQNLPLAELHPFQNHPFKVVDDEAMQRTVESVARYGVLAPAIARPRPEGGYEIISGHRRLHAAALAGLKTIPVIVRNMDDDAAVIAMVDANLQRETILPSERAFAYKMKLEAMKHQGQRTDLTSGQLGQKLTGAVSRDILAEQAGDSSRNVQRFIRLTELIPELLDMVDQKQLSFNPAVELSYLSQPEQHELLDAMDYAQSTPSLSQAQRLKKLSQEGTLNRDTMRTIMSEIKKPELGNVTLKDATLRKYFPRSYTPRQMQETIIKLLEQWQKRRQRDMER